jgi:fibronectin type 3 domain-containing protein
LDVTVGNPTYNSTTKVTTYTITWSQVAGASAYQYRTSDAANAATTEVTGTSATVTVPAGQTLKFSVRTKNLNNLSSFSDIKPLASQSLSAVSLNIPTVTATKIPLTWNAVTGATRYDIYRSSNGGSSYSLMNTVTTNKYDVTWTQNSGVQYRFYIVAKIINNSVKSNVITVNGKLTTPTLTATANGKTVNLSWNQVTGAQNYEVSRSINGGAWTVLDTPSGTSYAETLSGTPNPGTKYAYRIRAINTYVNSGYSTTATVTF